MAAMTQTSLGSTLVITNPAARGGRAALGEREVLEFLQKNPSSTTSYEAYETQVPGDAARIAATAQGRDTVLVVGGDGCVHDAVNGLMHIPEDLRPALGVVPTGTGNDFARSLGMTLNNTGAALRDIFQGAVRTVDLGVIDAESPMGPTYFMETLSFGLDAAIALDASRRHNERAGRGDSNTFASSGLSIFSEKHDGWPFMATLIAGIGGAAAEAAGEMVNGSEMIFAVQVGPTYGGGFKIAPDAMPTDGLLDVCWSAPIPSTVKRLALFGLARFGHHKGSDSLEFRKVQRLEISFPEEEPPCQVDGEPLSGNTHIIECAPNALKVIVPPSCPW